MAIPNITNANTFGQWLSTTQAVVSLANTLTDGPSFVANTHLYLTHAGETLNVANTATFTGNVAITGSGWGLNVSNSVYVGGDLLVGGNVTLDAIGFDDLTVSGNASIGNNATITGTLSVANTSTLSGYVAITGSGWGLNVSNSVYVGGDLLVGGNVTLDQIGFNDLTVTGNASIANNTTIGGTLSATGATTLGTLTFTTGFANTGTLQVDTLTVLNTMTLNVVTANTGTIPNVFFTTAFANTGLIQVYDATVLNTANIQILSGNCVNQFDTAGIGVAMAIALG